MYFSLIAEQPRFHITQIILRRFLISLDIPFQLKLLRLEKIARVIFIRDRHRSYVYLHQTVYKIPFTTHSQHLEHAVLRTVIGVLGTSFALCNPDGLILLQDCVMDVS